MACRADSFWAQFLGVDTGEWTTPGVSYRAHVGLRGYRGFWCFRRNDRVVVSAPLLWIPRLREMLSGWELERLMDPASLACALGANFDRSIGPAFQGFLRPERFSEAYAVAGIRKLRPGDAAMVSLLQADCPSEWTTSGLDEAGAWQHACVEGDKITAMAGYRARSNEAGEPCILTHPQFREQGQGTAVASAVVRDALARSKLLLYQTLDSNSSAVRIALTLGYERYATHIAVRLTGDSPEHEEEGDHGPARDALHPSMSGGQNVNVLEGRSDSVHRCEGKSR